MIHKRDAGALRLNLLESKAIGKKTKPFSRMIRNTLLTSILKEYPFPILANMRVLMIDGYLIVNLEPAYIGFSLARDNGEVSWHGRRYCTVEEIRTLLLELGVIEPDQHWPPQELMLRLSVRISRQVLEKMELIPMTGMELAS